MAKNRVKTHMHLFFSLIDRFYGYRSASTFDAHKVDIRTETDFLKSLLTNILGISATLVIAFHLFTDFTKNLRFCLLYYLQK